jgi:hypothetical protein
MIRLGLAGLIFGVCLSGTVWTSSGDDATLLRIFLHDGTSLVSYGEPSRVGDRVIFSLPTSTSVEDPQLHLVNIPAGGVDWERTNRYADSARAERYVATHAESQYVMLTADIGQVLNDVAQTADPLRRLAIVERARGMLADWPARHFNYRQADIHQMLAILDETIADLRIAAGMDRFDLSFVATAEPGPAREPLLPRPTAKEAIEQLIRAGGMSATSAERQSLYMSVLVALERDAAALPEAFVSTTGVDVRAAIAGELAIDRSYQLLTTRVLRRADQSARSADVRGLQRLLTYIDDQDAALGARRPDAVASLVATVDARLEEARRLQLERDRWALRLPEIRRFRTALAPPLTRLQALQAAIEDIRQLAGSRPSELAAVQQTVTQVLEVIRLLQPPDELRAAHTLLVSAAQLADSAARVRREAALSGDMARAWDASSAAAGALMLTERARAEMQAALVQPQLQQ